MLRRARSTASRRPVRRTLGSALLSAAVVVLGARPGPAAPSGARGPAGSSEEARGLRPPPAGRGGAQRRGRPGRSGGPRRPARLRRALGLTALATVLPGLGHLLLGRRRTGAGLLAVHVLGVGALASVLLLAGRDGVLQALVSARAMAAAEVVCVVVALAWAAVVVRTYLLARPPDAGGGGRVLGAAVVAALCLVVVVPLGAAATLADSQRTLLDAVFPTTRASAATGSGAVPAAGPVLPQPRLNVLLLGSDAGTDRTGTRTDTMIVASVDTRTAATLLVSLPRNLQRASFPAGSPMAARFPDGFHDPDAPGSGDFLLNAVHDYGVAHPDLAPAGPTADPGLNLLMSSISDMLALPLHHYVEVDMAGLAAFVDALGGVTVDVGPEPLPIGGVTAGGRRVRPDGYVPPGVQHLDGNQALWYARSRRDSDDYDRMGRQRCLIDAVLTQESPTDLLADFRAVAAAAAGSIRTDIPQTLLPALVSLVDRHGPPVLQSISFDPGLPDPAAPGARFDPARPDVPFMRRLVGSATAATLPSPTTPTSTTPTSTPTATATPAAATPAATPRTPGGGGTSTDAPPAAASGTPGPVPADAAPQPLAAACR